jgi:hypothetical protein
MKASEFRIGNWIYIPQTKTNEQIGSIEENGRFTTKNYKSSYSSIECLEPIPLTEEWLLKFGFKNNRLGLFDCIKVVEDIGFHISFIQRHLKEVQYVHQLQNLYFALTGEELTILS